MLAGIGPVRLMETAGKAPVTHYPAPPIIWVPVALAGLPMLIAIGGLGMAAPFCIIRSFSEAEAAVVAPFTDAGILLATFWGYVFFDDLPDAWTFVGALVIVGAGLYVWHRETVLARTEQRRVA
jgi:drug/metabolite transporter (DMT)-like permease